MMTKCTFLGELLLEDRNKWMVCCKQTAVKVLVICNNIKPTIQLSECLVCDHVMQCIIIAPFHFPLKSQLWDVSWDDSFCSPHCTYILSTRPLSVWTHHWGITHETFLKSIPEGPINVYHDIMMWTEMAVWEKCPSWKVILISCLVWQELLQYIFVLVIDPMQGF